MIVNLIYMALGVMMGFLFKHELDMKIRRRKAEKRQMSFLHMDTSPYDNTLRDVRELNHNLVVFQKKREAK